MTFAAVELDEKSTGFAWQATSGKGTDKCFNFFWKSSVFFNFCY